MVLLETTKGVMYGKEDKRVGIGYRLILKRNVGRGRLCSSDMPREHTVH